MKAWKTVVLVLLALVLGGTVGTALFIDRGFRAATEPSNFETGIARPMRDFAILTTRADRKILSKHAAKPGPRARSVPGALRKLPRWPAGMDQDQLEVYNENAVAWGADTFVPKPLTRNLIRTLLSNLKS